MAHASREQKKVWMPRVLKIKKDDDLQVNMLYLVQKTYADYFFLSKINDKESY